VTHPFVLYAAMILAAAFQEEFAPLAGALAAHHGHGEIWLVGAACAIGSWLHGKRPALLRPIEMLKRHEVLAMLGIRFAYGLRMTLPLVCGAADIGFGPFALYTALSSAAWAALFTTAGWFLGEFALTQIRHFRHYEIRAGIVLLGVGAIVWMWRHQRATIETGEPRVV
jgi:membrane protein DedA with SNARE-associated domain